MVLYPGTLHAVDELPIRLAWQEDTNSESSAHLTPSTDGISNLYTPYLFVVLFTETVICSSVLADKALKTQSILTSAPADKEPYKNKMSEHLSDFFFQQVRKVVFYN